MTDSSKTTGTNGGLLGKLLLPGYTDSGANTSFQPAQTSDNNDDDDDDGGGGGGAMVNSSTDYHYPQGSEAATEIRDNRSAAKEQFRLNSNASRNQHHHHQSSSSSASSSPPKTRQPRYIFSGDDKTASTSAAATAAASSASLLIPGNQAVGDPESRYAGFFPSTKPQLSPRPSSPPLVTTTEQLSTSLLVVPETTGTAVSLLTDNNNQNNQNNNLEKENQRRFQFWENEGNNIKDHGEKKIISARSLTLNATNLQKVEHQGRINNNNNYNSPTDSSSSTNNGPNRNLSIMNDDDDDAASDAMSTASEMGTVIETGNHAARMAEIDAMAALIEATSPNVETLTPRPESSFPLAPSQISQRRTAAEESSLALPELDSNKTNNRAGVILTQQLKANSATLLSSSELGGLEKKAPAVTTNPTASEMLSSALRRVGTGLNKAKASLSAPPTPKTPGVPPTPRVEDLLKSISPRRNNKNNDLDSSQGEYLPASLALRSPGSSARLSLRRRSHQQQEEQDDEFSSSRPILAPRFSPSGTSRALHSSLSFESGLHGNSERIAAFRTLPSSVPTLSRRELTEPLKLTSPFRLAQKCFSYDSTLDDSVEEETGSATSSHIVNLETSYPLHRRTEYQRTTTTNKIIQESASWDVGGASGAFRAQPHRSHRIGGLRATESQLERNAQRVRVYSDFSPRGLESVGSSTPTRRPQQYSMGQKTDVLELQTPERYVVDVEREDALDILACLVERGVTAWNEEPIQNSNKTNESTESSANAREALIATMTEELRKSSKDSSESDEMTTEKVASLEELLKSHAYALEMKRAALSASTWLKSIGRGPTVPNDQDFHVQQAHLTSVLREVSEVGQASGEGATSDKQPDEISSSFSATAADTKMEFLTLRARLHSAESELREKTIMNEKLDEELSKCRAEIGRLRTASRNELSVTHNRSMFDEDAEESNTVSTGASVEVDPPKKDVPPTSPPAKEEWDKEKDNKMFDESFQGNNSLFQDASIDENNRSQQSENLDVLILKTALEQANDTIRLLHEKLQKEKSEDEPPTVDVPENSVSVVPENKVPEKASPPLPSDEHRTINVRMLDGENFVTDWDDLTSPLPPPPDHGLRSPIVYTVLDQWTDDQGLHDSLLAWMERVMTGDNLEDSVPPLTISSLDHQVRDGFMMHVLPILLRRADIHVAVQMRAHRRTTYDLAVSVRQKRPLVNGHSGDPRSPSLLDHHAHEDWNSKKNFDRLDSGSHSAVTVPMNNGQYGPGYQGESEEDPEYSHFDIPHAASHDMDENPQSTFMGALGGALGGLLSRGKYTAVQSPSRFHANASPQGFPPPPSVQATLDAASSSNSGPSGNRVAELDHQPYHRVVSAPPGRIGVTFVEYRGHAMVADMAPDSPLSSWVFPSDILIAVDEVPVSGMRVRDIIQILTKRKDRQRALRVISSHAMNEFTLNQSGLGDEAP